MTTLPDLSRVDPRRPPVVLLGGINLVRALALAGIPAIVAASDPDEPAFASRHCLAAVLLPPLGEAEAAVGALVALGEHLARAAGRRVPLVFSNDDALGLVTAHRERLQRYFLFLTNEPEIAQALLSKDLFQDFAVRRGIPVPRPLAWTAGPGSVAGTPGPVLVKPRTKLDWHRSPLCHRLFGGDGKARIFASGAQAAANPLVSLYRDQLTVQEYIPGDERDQWSYHGLADGRGEVLAGFVGRKLRTYPAVTGESAFIELRHDESLERLGRDIARRCPLKGVFKMDFKRDAASGRWYLLEINARFTLWHYLGAANGVNLAAAAYEYLIGGTRPRQERPATAFRWLCLGLDYRAYRERAARGELSLAAWLASIALTRKVYNIFAWSDPGPFVRLWSRRISRRAERGAMRVLAALRVWRSTAS